MIETIFWAGLAIVVYTYIGYALVISILAKIKKNQNKFEAWDESELPTVTLVVPAFNEADFIETKIANCKALRYPKDKLTLLFVADGSSDETPQLIAQHDDVKLLFAPPRKGKAAAINRAMKIVDTDIVVFNDANTLLDEHTILNLVQPFTDKKVAGASGEKQIIIRNEDGTNAKGEGLYWKYESYLKRKDAEVASVMGAAGELIAFRTNMVTHLEEDTILDDFMMSLRMVEQGYKIAYVPEARAVETASATVTDELTRKVRIAAGGWQAMQRLSSLLGFWKHPLVSFMYVSHRVLRWSVSAFLLPILFLLNGFLLGQGAMYQLLFVAQVLFYALAFVGYVNQLNPNQRKVFFVPFYFTIMNYAVWAGFFRFKKGSQSAAWQRAQRAV